MTISSSPPRKQVVISSPSSAGSCSRSVAASSDSGVPHSRIVRCRSSARPAKRGLHDRVGQRRRPHVLQLARRTGQHEHRRAAASLGDRHHQSRRRTDRGEHRARRAGTIACLRVAAAVAAASVRQPRPALSRSMMAAMCCSNSASSTGSRPWKRATTSAVRSSAVGPSPPDVMSRSTPVPAR